MVLTNESIKNKAAWEALGYRLPKYDRDAMIEKTVANPTWLHFGAGNIFKAFQADACQRLLDAGLAETGIIAAERREKKPEANDNLTVKVTLKADGNVEKAVVASIAEKVYLYGNESRLREIFENPSLQMVSFTITEKGYALYDANGELLPDIAADLAGTPEDAKSYMGKITGLLCARYLKNKAPLAMVSMDNCSHNGDKLKAAITCFAEKWGGEGFNKWISEQVSFPWSMIDKITPGPDASVAAMLKEDGLEDGTPFVNAEECEYLVIEDNFPNGRPALEKAGIYFTDRETGLHLPQPPAHQSRRIRLPAGLQQDLERDAGRRPPQAGGDHRLQGGPARRDRSRHHQAQRLHRRGGKCPYPEPLYARHAPAHRDGHLAETAHSLRRDDQSLHRLR